ncbi:glycosyltransferase family 2 protein, partial [bacterium]|nr:glycosyltransferase family 2 protein [bacterium]
MSLAAVTVHHGNSDLTERLIESLSSCALVHPIIVVLHDSFPLPKRDRVQYLECENRGYAAGLNRAVAHALTEVEPPQLVLALNPDVEVDAAGIEHLFADHSAAGADCTFPVLREKDRLLYGYRFSRWGALQSVKEPEWYSGACLLFSTEAWKKVGGFEESYFHYFEDRDFCLKFREAGLKLHQAKVIVDHQGKSGIDYPASELPRFAVRNHLIALEKSGLLGPVSFLNVAARHFA